MNENQKTAMLEVAVHLDQKAAEWQHTYKQIEQEESMPHLSIRWTEAKERYEAYTQAAALVRKHLA